MAFYPTASSLSERKTGPGSRLRPWLVRTVGEGECAASVLGIDISKNMITQAKKETSLPDIDYKLADLETLKLPAKAFDFAYSSLCLHYIKNLNGLIQTVFETLTPGSYFIFSIEHPIYMAALNPSWLVDEKGNRTWPVNHYSVEGSRITSWLSNRVTKQHRTIATTLNTLMDSGFIIRHIQEWAPSQEQIHLNPDLKEEIERPMILIASCQR